jgi:hypothetical protein
MPGSSLYYQIATAEPFATGKRITNRVAEYHLLAPCLPTFSFGLVLYFLPAIIGFARSKRDATKKP